MTLTLCVFEQHAHERFQGLLALALGCELERRVVVWRQRQGQQGGKERYRVCRRKSILSEHLLQLLQLLVC